jgi:hypothetical protein
MQACRKSLRNEHQAAVTCGHRNAVCYRFHWPTSLSRRKQVIINYRLPPFPKKANRSVDHNHDYYDLNHVLNSHVARLLKRPNCVTDGADCQERRQREAERS